MKMRVCDFVPYTSLRISELHSSSDLDILSVGDVDTCGTYIFDMKGAQRGAEFRKAVLFARQQLLQVNAKKGYNLLLLER